MAAGALCQTCGGHWPHVCQTFAAVMRAVCGGPRGVRGVLKREKKQKKSVPIHKKTACSHMFNHGWWRWAVGGW